MPSGQRRFLELKSLKSISFSCGLAALLSLLLREEPTKLVAPLILLLVVIPTSYFFGTRSAVITVLRVGLVSVVLLFPPFGHLYVQDKTDQITLVLFEVIAICVAYLTPKA